MTDWTDDKRARAAHLWLEGKSTSEIGSMLGKTRNSIIGLIHRAGLKRGEAESQWTDERRAEAVKLNNEGLSARQVAERLGTTTVAVRELLKRMGVQSKWRPVKAIPVVRPPKRRVPAPPPPPVYTTGIPFAALTPNSCRWIVEGSGEYARFCEDASRDGSSYCTHHHGIAYKPMLSTRRSDRDTVRRQQWSM